MATVAQVAKASLQRILVQQSEADLEPDEYQDFIFAMNNYMLALDGEGVTLGYTVVENLGDEVTIAGGALRGLIANMAIEVSPDYNGTITPALVAAAKEGLRVMRIIGQGLSATRYPSTLPIGSGNEYYPGWSPKFYPCTEDEILAETTGAISLESGTNEAADNG